MKKINLPDKVRLINATVDGYGDTVVLEEETVRGAFFQGMAVGRQNNTDLIETYDAHCYIDEGADMVINNSYRIEGMYLVCNPYGAPEAESWYRIKDVKLGVTKLVDNRVNNCHCFLEKVEKLTEPESS